MNLPNSSTSSSKAPAMTHDRRRGWMLVSWAFIWLVAIDFAVSMLFAYPQDPKNLHPSPLALYFDYGRSMEARLRRSTRVDPQATAPITKAGWYDPLIAVTRPASRPDAPEVTIYGMSHAVRLADALHHVSAHYQVRSVGAPGATTNWAYGAFLRDKERDRSKAVVLAIMSSTLSQILSPAPMDWNSSFPLPYTADNFRIHEGKLIRTPPPYDSFAGYVRTLDDPQAWQSALRQFARTDPFYDPFLVRQSWLDHSVIVRLVRRAWGQRRDRIWRNRVLTAKGFDRNSQAVQVANAIVADFARQARKEGLLPIIYVVDSFGYSDQLYRALRSTLDRDHIPYIASHDFIDPMNPSGYLPDSHFTPSNDRLLARALARLLDEKLADQGRSARKDSP